MLGISVLTTGKSSGHGEHPGRISTSIELIVRLVRRVDEGPDGQTTVEVLSSISEFEGEPTEAGLFLGDWLCRDIKLRTVTEFGFGDSINEGSLTVFSFAGIP